MDTFGHYGSIISQKCPFSLSLPIGIQGSWQIIGCFLVVFWRKYGCYSLIVNDRMRVSGISGRQRMRRWEDYFSFAQYAFLKKMKNALEYN